MRYQFLVDTYETERLKVLSVWTMFEEGDLPVRPRGEGPHGRSVHEHMVHQCVGEDAWFKNMLGIDVAAAPLPESETKLAFLQQYAEDSGNRLEALSSKPESWWEETVPFFEVQRSRAWILVRRIAHTAHHRGQLTTLLRVLGRPVYSTYGPTEDTGGLTKNGATVIYPYKDIRELIESEVQGGRKARLPGPGSSPVSERPRSSSAAKVQQ
ncbi:MAG: DinB family protein [Gemmatimonadales bacterium]